MDSFDTTFVAYAINYLPVLIALSRRHSQRWPIFFWCLGMHVSGLLAVPFAEFSVATYGKSVALAWVYIVIGVAMIVAWIKVLLWALHGRTESQVARDEELELECQRLRDRRHARKQQVAPHQGYNWLDQGRWTP